jgi:hypothetical protein
MYRCESPASEVVATIGEMIWKSEYQIHRMNGRTYVEQNNGVQVIGVRTTLFQWTGSPSREWRGVVIPLRLKVVNTNVTNADYKLEIMHHDEIDFTGNWTAIDRGGIALELGGQFPVYNATQLMKVEHSNDGIIEFDFDFSLEWLWCGGVTGTDNSDCATPRFIVYLTPNDGVSTLDTDIEFEYRVVY